MTGSTGFLGKADFPATVRGDNLGTEFPTSIEALFEGGTSFLTDACKAAGALKSDNRIVRIGAAEEFHGGGMGRKLTLSVEYARDEPGLHRSLFVKFPRDFDDHFVVSSRR